MFHVQGKVQEWEDLLRTGDRSNVIETRLKKEVENLRREKEILNEDIDVSVLIVVSFSICVVFQTDGFGECMGHALLEGFDKCPDIFFVTFIVAVVSMPFNLPLISYSAFFTWIAFSKLQVTCKCKSHY